MKHQKRIKLIVTLVKLQGMSIKIFLLLLTAFLLFQLNAYSQNIEGRYIHSISKIMGGFKISITSEIEIEKDENQTLSYFLKKTVTDEYSGGIPRTEYFIGTVKKINSQKFKFYGGDYGKSGGNITLNSSQNKSINQFTILFPPGNGNPMTFTRKD